MRRFTSEGHLDFLVASWAKRAPVSFVYHKFSTDVSLDDIRRIYSARFLIDDFGISPLYGFGEWLISMSSDALSTVGIDAVHSIITATIPGSRTGSYSAYKMDRIFESDIVRQRFLETIDVSNNSNNMVNLFEFDIEMMSVHSLVHSDVGWDIEMRSKAYESWIVNDSNSAGYIWYESFNTSHDRVLAMREVIEAVKSDRLNLLYDMVIGISQDCSSWNRAKRAFESIRNYSNSNPGVYRLYVAEIHMLETFAKSVYNESCDKTIFDRDSSWNFVPLVKHLLIDADKSVVKRVERFLFER